ncbi:MAG: GNAT family N-acetyltransferase [Chloroflexi bacterium]|nr:GNAT family N-acetyltransferase [Chloroflexota bacterium]
MTVGPLAFLPWDSAHFGMRIGRATTRQLDNEAWRKLEEACQELNLDCLYFLAAAADHVTIAALLESGFAFVDIRLTFEARVDEVPSVRKQEGLLFRAGSAYDLEALRPIAAGSYRRSRFYVDPRFSDERASLMYQIWLEKSLTAGFADHVVVAESSGRAVGFITIHLDKPSGEGNIGLVGVAEAARGKGCASGMLRHASQWLAARGRDCLNVVTQGSNVSAQRLYQRCGFVTRSVELWFHKWFD